MDNDKWKQHEVPENVLCQLSRIPKLKLQSLKKVEENSTPVSELCVSVTNSTLATPMKAAQHSVEPILVETRVKPLQKLSAVTQSPTSCYKPTISQLFTPECASLEDIRATISLSPLQTPRTTKSHSLIGSPPCVALGKTLKTKIVNSSPKSSHKSVNVLKSCIVPEKEEITKDEKADNLKSLKDNSTKLTLSDKSHKLQEFVIDPVNKICEEDQNSNNAHLGESLCVGSAGSANVPNPLDWLPDSLHKTIVSHSSITSEPRLPRKSDDGVVCSRSLSFSAKKSSKQKNVIPEYDPDDDIFAQGLMPVQFNIISLKNQIGQLLHHADIPSPQLRKSYSCGMLNNDVQVTQPVTPVSSRRKQSKRTPSSAPKATIKRTLSAPELQKPDGLITSALSPPLPPKSSPTAASKTASSCSEVSSEGKIRALLRARDIIKNIREHAKDICCVSSKEVKQPSDSKSIKTKNEEITSCVSQTLGSSSGTRDLAKEETDTSDLLPPTQPYESIILVDVTAYVEVISKNEDLSAGARKELVKLGATVVPAFNRDVPVTHVVFNDGNISTYKKAIKRNIPLVSVLWIEACRKAGVKVHESLFPPYQIERYESPAIQKELKKRRIMRFYSDKRRPSSRLRKGVIHIETPVQSSTESFDQNNAVRESACSPKWVEEVAGGNGRVRMLIEMTGISEKEFKELVNRPPTPDSDIEMDETSPLPVRLLRKLAKNLPVNSNLDILDETSKCREASDIAASFSNKASYENSFAKKLIEVERMEEHMEIGDKHNEEITKTLSVSVVKLTSQAEHTNMLNVTQRRTVLKQRLLNSVQKSITVTNENDEDDNDNAVVRNPHSCTPSKLNGDMIWKKRKFEIEQLDGPEINGLDDNKAVVFREKEYVMDVVNPVKRSRRSSSFVKSKRSSPSRILQKPAIVCTQLHTVDINLVASVVEQLGMFVIEKNVTSHTTHIVAGAAKQTIELLKGMVRGCWVVSNEWVLRSLEAGKWLDEKEFELTTFSPSVQKYRLEKVSFGGILKPDIFSSCGPIFVSSQATTSRGDLVELILLCGGETVSRIRKAKVAVGKKYPDIICVTAKWVLDSIQYYCCKPFDDYLCK